MINTKKMFVMVLLVLCLVPLVVFAQDDGSEQRSRRGIFFSLVGFAGGELVKTEKASVGGGARLGGGITENFLLYLEARGSVIPSNFLNNLCFEDLEIKAQYYAWQGLYMNLGVGAAFALSTVDALMLKTFKTGPSGSFGVGYEFRFGKRFFLSPEFMLVYKHVGNNSFLTTEVGGQLGWHF